MFNEQQLAQIEQIADNAIKKALNSKLTDVEVVQLNKIIQNTLLKAIDDFEYK